MTARKRKKLITTLIVLTYFVFFFTYAYFRYIYFLGLDMLVNANFVINKSFAGAAVLSVFTAFWLSTLSKLGNKFAIRHISYKRFFGLAGFYFMCLHVFFGLRIAKPDILPQFFFENGDFSVQGQIIFLLGILGFSLFLFPAISSMKDVMTKLGKKKWLIFQRIGYAAFFVILIHASAVGYQNWLNPNKWPGMMPPITLICVIFLLSGLLLRLIVLFKLKK